MYWSSVVSQSCLLFDVYGVTDVCLSWRIQCSTSGGISFSFPIIIIIIYYYAIRQPGIVIQHDTAIQKLKNIKQSIFLSLPSVPLPLSPFPFSPPLEDVCLSLPTKRRICETFVLSVFTSRRYAVVVCPSVCPSHGGAVLKRLNI